MQCSAVLWILGILQYSAVELRHITVVFGLQCNSDWCGTDRGRGLAPPARCLAQCFPAASIVKIPGVLYALGKHTIVSATTIARLQQELSS